MSNTVDRIETVFAGHEGNKLAADIFGDAENPVVLLLHGGGQTRHAWNPTARRLAGQGWCAITLDQRGHGDSNWPENGHYTHEDFAGDLRAVCAQIEAQFGSRPVSVGASLGGIASLTAEVEDPGNTLAALVLVDITPRVNEDGVIKIRDFMMSNMKEGFATLEEAADAIQNYMPTRRRERNLEGLRKNLRQHADGRFRWHWDPRFWEGPRPVSTNRDTLRVRLTEAAKSLVIPTLLVRGRESELVEQAHVDEFMELVPHAKFTDISGAGHMVAGDRNDIFAEAVIEFLNELPQAPGAAA